MIVGNLDYVVSEGGQRMNQSWDPVENGQLVPEDKAVGRKLADDAMFRSGFVQISLLDLF